MSRGRKSTAELTTPVVSRLDQRPEPPPELTGEAINEWRAVVGRMPPTWFTRENFANLVAVCTRTVRLRELRRLAEVEEINSPAEMKLRAEIRAEEQANLYQQRAMRLVQHARQDSKKTSGTPTQRPWEQTA